MKVVSIIVLVLVVCLCLVSIRAQHDPYTVPHPLIEVFRPRGLRVSIPDNYPGIRLFAFHGVVNRDLHGLEAGDLSKDILKKKNGRWVFEDKRLKLNLGDVLHFWLFVIKDNLGYRLDDQTYVVTGYEDAPPGFNNNSKNPNQKPTSSPPNTECPSSPSLEAAQCVCPLRPIEIINPICNLPSTTENPQQSTTPFNPPESLLVLRELLENISKENTYLRNQLVEVQEDKTYLVTKLEKIPDFNIHKLILSGGTYNKDSAVIQVETVLREKLGISNFNIVQSAVTTEQGTIIFELSTLEDKLFVLRKAKEKLGKSKIKIDDTQSVVLETK